MKVQVPFFFRDRNRIWNIATFEQVHNAGEHYERSDTEQLPYIY